LFTSIGFNTLYYISQKKIFSVKSKGEKQKMKAHLFLMILEYLVYTLPFALGVFLSFRWFLSRKSFERFVYIGAFLLPCVSIVSLIKVFYILEHSPTPDAFCIPKRCNCNLGFVFVFRSSPIILSENQSQSQTQQKS